MSTNRKTWAELHEEAGLPLPAIKDLTSEEMQFLMRVYTDPGEVIGCEDYMLGGHNLLEALSKRKLITAIGRFQWCIAIEVKQAMDKAIQDVVRAHSVSTVDAFPDNVTTADKATEIDMRDKTKL